MQFRLVDFDRQLNSNAMERFNIEQISQFLTVEKVGICSADHREVREGTDFWGDTETISGMTISTTTTTTRLNLQ